jgi:hypothetical protein
VQSHVEIRESAEHFSPGVACVWDIQQDLFVVDSFFDVFFDVTFTDVDPNAVAIGDEMEMTFRYLYTADGIHNYFWKARPRR